MENTEFKGDLYKIGTTYLFSNIFRKTIPFSLLFLHNSQNINTYKLIDYLYREITLKNNKEFIVCIHQNNKISIPSQKATLESVVHDSCVNSVGTIHSHPTHLDDYLCEPSDYDWKDFKRGTDKFLGIACYNKKIDSVYVNIYGK